jgi:hypothetical protein
VGGGLRVFDTFLNFTLIPSFSALRTHNYEFSFKVSRIFDDRCTQQELFEEILEQPTNEIFTGSNWLLCTLGLTNSGKYFFLNTLNSSNKF